MSSLSQTFAKVSSRLDTEDWRRLGYCHPIDTDEWRNCPACQWLRQETEIAERRDDLLHEHEADIHRRLGAANPLRRYRLGDVPASVTRYAVQDLIALPSLICIASPPKRAKSTVCRDMALSLAAGGTLWGMSVLKPGPVLYYITSEADGNPADYDAFWRKHVPDGIDGFVRPNADQM